MGDAISPVLLEVIMEIELWKLGSLLWGIVSAYVVILGLRG
ncbi:hypothetical protein YPPY66_2891 [Yersinia pestis PY-66]|jgi:hypothetical protein|uniref:Uncharacterized protein n=1 Tax=Yersinia pestis PY-08 TaxID=992134 RepID=A0AB72ZJ46_YERPE|nr:hypothetical protein YpF1991016_3965 [Yersinia pestis biovar Orientalis str. F1991016]EDR55915.1 hypothetical protein YpMG051020_2800 [Yersinia pestis biovar Orientalis str. MG05-1020]EIQ87905.1 hypothetical protein YPPY01_2586 [Yersinia pestis PY-01]EIQ89328.1 hypothetical protein YPPY02_2622 [Yersinia pestis PY-02]EIQ90124.1 hypothetical protein YPPY03_2682 [Yersinia pestis PY-03]EIR01551.1 hypothetical protein YPPY04_2655 [Yersinia pestis PY-04]EIR03090.1 hypothetical protein YPPY05_262